MDKKICTNKYMKLIYVYKPGCPFCNKVNPEWQKAKLFLQCKSMKIKKSDLHEHGIESGQVP